MPKQRLTFYNRAIAVQGAGSVPWIHWVNDPGSQDLQDAFEGGEPASVPYAIVDLSAAASAMMGRQMSQAADYKLRGVTIAYRPTDDNILTAENESETMFGGMLRFWPNTDHFKEAMALARRVESHGETGVIDADSLLLSTEKDYSGFRVGFSTNDDVKFATAEGLSGLSAGVWTISEIQAIYNTMTAPDQQNALFNGRFPRFQELGWSAVVSSGAADDTSGVNGLIHTHQDYERIGLNHEVGMGLVGVYVTHSSMASAQGLVEDDYQWFIGMDFEVTY